MPEESKRATTHEVSPSLGLVGFFDILGYSNILENNEVIQSASIVLDILQKLPERTFKLQSSLVDKSALHVLNEVQDKIKWLIFSDTILITLECPEKREDIEEALSWLLFSLTSIILYRDLFEKGLPVRGGISFGNFYIKDTCFVGDSIINAYKTEKNLNLAAIGFHQSAVEYLKTANKLTKDIIETISFRYLTPCKSGLFPQRLLMPSHPKLPRILPENNDIRQFISNSFWKHNKDISAEAIEKLNNTELFFRFYLSKNECI